MEKKDLYLSDEEISYISVANQLYDPRTFNACKAISQASADYAVKKLLIGIGKEAKRIDGTVYLVPDYAKYKQAMDWWGIVK